MLFDLLSILRCDSLVSGLLEVSRNFTKKFRYYRNRIQVKLLVTAKWDWFKVSLDELVVMNHQRDLF